MAPETTKPGPFDTVKDKAARAKVHGLLVDFCRSNPPSVIQGKGRTPRSKPTQLTPAAGVSRYLAKIQEVKRGIFALNTQERLNYTLHRLLGYLGQLVVYSHGYKPQYTELAKRLAALLEVRLTPLQVVECAFCGQRVQKRFMGIHLRVHEKDETPAKVDVSTTTGSQSAMAPGEVKDDDQLFFDPEEADLLRETNAVDNNTFEDASKAIGYDSVAPNSEPYLRIADHPIETNTTKDSVDKPRPLKPGCPVSGCPAPFTVEHPNLIHCHRQTRAFGQRMRNDLLFSAVFVASKTRGTRQMVKVRTGGDPIPLWIVLEVKHGVEVRAAAVFHEDGADVKAGMAIKFRLVAPDGMRSPEDNWGIIAPMVEKNLCQDNDLAAKWEVLRGNSVYLLDGFVPRFFG